MHHADLFEHMGGWSQKLGQVMLVMLVPTDVKEKKQMLLSMRRNPLTGRSPTNQVTKWQLSLTSLFAALYFTFGHFVAFQRESSHKNVNQNLDIRTGPGPQIVVKPRFGWYFAVSGPSEQP